MERFDRRVRRDGLLGTAITRTQKARCRLIALDDPVLLDDDPASHAKVIVE
jgi:hypothetical protein